MNIQDSITFGIATAQDLSEVIALLIEDELGKQRELQSPSVDPAYTLAFNEICTDSQNELIVGKMDGKVIAVLQMTCIPNLTLKGTKRMQIEGVRVASAFRNKGIGRKLFQYAFDRAKAKGCRLAQLTTHQSRSDAIRFYEALGFQATHIGFKLNLVE